MYVKFTVKDSNAFHLIFLSLQALFNEGEYRLIPSLCHLSVDALTWNKANTEQKGELFRRIYKLDLGESTRQPLAMICDRQLSAPCTDN